jgi:menaquinone-dependent protoporphyrinogen oxidase
LRTRPNLFLSISLAIASRSEDERQAARNIAETFCEENNWNPDRIVHGAGGVYMKRYGWLTRLVMRQILRKEGVKMPPSGELELTDWEALKTEFSRFLDRVGTASAPS